MSTPSSLDRILRSAILLLLAASGAAFLASCEASPDDPPADVSTTATIDDYIGAWTDGATTNLVVSANASVSGAGDFDASSTVLEPSVGTMTIASGKASLSSKLSMSYDSTGDRIVYSVLTLTRVGAGSGSVVGQWAYPGSGTATISLSFSGSASYGTAILTTLGTSKTGTYTVSGSAVSLRFDYGTATMNAAKDEITLNAIGKDAPMVLTKGSTPLKG